MYDWQSLDFQHVAYLYGLKCGHDTTQLWTTDTADVEGGWLVIQSEYSTDLQIRNVSGKMSLHYPVKFHIKMGT